MKIAVVGCGGIGGIVTGVLASKGLDVSCIESDEKNAGLLNERGIHLTGKKGELFTKIKAFPGFSQEMGKYDIIIIAVKSDALRQVFSQSFGYLCEHGFILTLQNGIEILSIAQEFPKISITPGAVGYNSIMLDYGRYLVTSQGGITVGKLNTSTQEDLIIIKGIMEPEIRVSTTENIEGVLWAKLLIVCGVTGLGGVSGLVLGDLLKNKEARKLFYRIITEGALVAGEMGIKLEKFAGALNPVKFTDLKDAYPLIIREMLLRIVGKKYKDLKSNIHHSLEKSQKTEIDFLNGAVVRKGETFGIPTPVNNLVVKMVKEIEAGKRKMSVENLKEMLEMVSG